MTRKTQAYITMLRAKLLTYLELMRYLVCFSVFLMAIIGYWLSIHAFDFSNLNILFAAVAVAASLAFGNVFNDILDLEADRVNYPRRPIPSGRVTLREAKWVAGFFLAASLLGSGLAGGQMLLFMIFLLAAATVYDLWASKIPIVGKVIVAAWSALTLATGYFVVEAGSLPLVPILTAFFFILAREFMETISDDLGDKIGGRKSIYALLGKTRVLQISFSLVLMSMVVLFVPVFTSELASRTLYILTVSLLLILPAAVAVIAVWRDQSPGNIRTVAHWVGVVFFSSFLSFLWLV
jgi:geranylgeranylglycerol-phosphate geranylgeranyltransferase